MGLATTNAHKRLLIKNDAPSTCSDTTKNPTSEIPRDGHKFPFCTFFQGKRHTVFRDIPYHRKYHFFRSRFRAGENRQHTNGTADNRYSAICFAADLNRARMRGTTVQHVAQVCLFVCFGDGGDVSCPGFNPTERILGTPLLY